MAGSSASPALPPGATVRQGILSLSKDVSPKEVIRLSLGEDQQNMKIDVQDGASASVFLQFHGSAGDCSLDVALADNASLSLVCLHAGKVPGKIVSRITVGAHARLHLTNVTLGDATCDVRSEVVGEGGQSFVDWVFLARGEDHQQLSVRNVFPSKRGGGEIVMKGIAQDRAVVSARGFIEIGEGGAGTQTYLTQKVLMLDASAKVDAVPGLEIKTNDVKASHSASVAKVSEEDLFYITSRGIPWDEARALLIRGFLEDLLGRIENAGVREEVMAEMEERLSSEGLVTDA